MQGWGMIGAYMFALLFLQFLAYRYLRDRGSDVENGGPGARSVEGDGSADGRRGGRLALNGRTGGTDRIGGAEPNPETADGERRCPHCGTENELDPAFVYCRDCVGRLGGY